jgi:hypothetical protein
LGIRIEYPGSRFGKTKQRQSSDQQGNTSREGIFRRSERPLSL